MSFWRELRRRNVVKVGVAYALVAWILAQIVTLVSGPLVLPDWFDTAVLVLLAIGFPVALLFAWAYELTPAGLKWTEDVPREESITHVTGRKLNYIVLGLFAGALLGSGSAWILGRNIDAQWAREEAIPEIEKHIEAGEWEAAYALAKEVQERVPENSVLADLWPRFSRPVSITSVPPGARVFRSPYDVSEGNWEELGLTPLDEIRTPTGLSRLRFELDGYRPLLRAQYLGGSVIGGVATNEQPLELPPFKLDTQESLPEGKVRVAGWRANLGGEIVELQDFFLARYEVTNREYKAFVDAGGYDRREYWQHPFVRDGQEVPWSAVRELFTDKTGRPGPATWEAGDYPDGEGDYPVQGLSWYEAMAYAEFENQELPTVHHWRTAFRVDTATWVMPASNVDGDGPSRVGQYQGISWYGAYDMAGNVREWTFNAVGDQRFILGGGWNDPYYVAANMNYAQSPFDRSETNGIRLAITNDSAAVIEKARRDLPVQTPPDYSDAEPVSDEILEIYRSFYAYDSTPLNSKVEARQEERSWIRERITFDASYGDERVPLYLYLPRTASPPYQTIVFLPGRGAWSVDSLDQSNFELDFIVRNGRAVAWPVYKGSFERRDELGMSFNEWTTQAGRNRIIAIMQDLSRSLDYLETRRDLDAEAFGYYGRSMGGTLAPLSLTLEPRLRVAVLRSGGFSYLNFEFLPEIDPGRYLGRIEQPVLMLNGLLDSIVPLETHARPFFERIGSEDKKLVVGPGGHFVPRAMLIRETLDWLDRHLGPTEQ